MKTRVQIENKCGENLHLKRKISKITELLFQIDEIKQKSAVSGLEVEVLSFGLVYTNDDEITEINRKYRKKDAPTDVITFALFADDKNKFVFNKTVELGEIVISLDTAKKQCGCSSGPIYKKEILTLITHGILHLLGFDHLTKRDYNFVVGIQDSIISKL